MNDYIVDAFTQTEDKVNLEVDNLNVECITSKNNNFNVDSEGNLTVKSVSAEQGMMSQATIRDFVYPVGSIYMSINSTSPATLFGGTWERIKHQFLLGCGDSTDLVGTTGGERNHQLTIAELPRHHHEINRCYGGGTSTDSDDRKSSAANLDGAWWNNGYTTTVGGDVSHNNMPPYLAVYIWKRIA